MSRCLQLVLVIAVPLLFVLPSETFAQASIAGTVKDTSGAVLPGVTVEASSPALIEKTRSVVTGGTGQYTIADLRPGSYVVTFTLPGFNTLKREGIQLTGSFTATVDAEMKVGAVEETVTVTGESPIVDVQGTTKQDVLPHGVIESLPSGAKTYATLASLIPAVSMTNATRQDVGGSFGGTQVNLIAHGSHTDDLRVTQNGLPIMPFGSNIGGTAPNAAAAQEVSVDTAAVSAELAQGGPRVNYIPRDGGNTFSGTIFGGYTNGSLQSDNLTKNLKDRGLTSANNVKAIWDFNPGVGGPLKKDRLWFYATARYFGTNLYAAGMYYNLNALDPGKWTYAPDQSRRAENDQAWTDAQLRLTWQATPRNKLAFSGDSQTRCSCPANAGQATNSPFGFRTPEAANDQRYPRQPVITSEWSSPLTSRLLLEAAGMWRAEGWGNRPSSSQGYPYPGIISVVEQSNNLTYRASATYNVNSTANYAYRAAVSYITGTHAFKIGINDVTGHTSATTFSLSNPPISYRFNNGVPNQLTIYDTPYTASTNVDADWGVFFQDKWTLKRWTISYGVRYDNTRGSLPEQHLGPTALVPGQDITFPAQPGVQNLKDVTPRFGVVWDLFGNGKTALKLSANKYLRGNGQGVPFNPVTNSLVLSTTRTWTDNGNFIPDCNVTAVARNLECGPLNNASFGQLQQTSSYDPDRLAGWGNRFYNWEFSVGVQQQVLPRASVDVSYFRRIFGNFPVTDNLLVSASDYTTYSITAPLDSRLPGGGGYTISGLVDLNGRWTARAATAAPTTASPSGRRASPPEPYPSAIGSEPNSAASVVIMIGRNLMTHPSYTASIGDFPNVRSCSSAKSICMIAFFLTMPMSITRPTNE